MITNAIAIFYGAAMAVNLAWPRAEFYGTKWYQQYGPDHRDRDGRSSPVWSSTTATSSTSMEILPEHRADALSPAQGQAAGTL